MSIPRAKIITYPWLGTVAYTGLCADCGHETYTSEEVGEVYEEAVYHLRDAHGVRTVGSLTADDIGKWIEVEGRKFQLDEVWHARRDCSLFAANAGPHDASCIAGIAPSTPCRVTEERP